MKTAIITCSCVIAFVLDGHAIEFHVAIQGKDSNPGTRAAPFRTIQHAADLAQPGDVITVHAGVYRERISPPRGGTSGNRRIVYQSAPGEKVEVKGSEIVTNWVKVQDDVWKATIPNSFFGSFNPYTNLIHGDWFDPKGRQHHTGAVYLNGDWLMEAEKLDDVLKPAGNTPSTTGKYLLNVAWIRSANDTGRIDAAGFAAKHGIQTAPCSEGGQCIGWIQDGDWVRYDRVDFGNRTERLEIHAASATGGGKIEIHADSPDGELLGTCLVPSTGGWQSWNSFNVVIKPTSGVKNLCLVFKSTDFAGLWFGQADKENTTIWAQFRGINPNEQLVEINVRQTVFYPKKAGVNYITVRGFTMEQAATPWAPPTAEQIGIIGTHWSKGWIIENNIIRDSTCCGIALGKYGDQWDNKSANTAEGYIQTVKRALANGWSKEKIGHHLVRNNDISYCGQTGIVGSLGAAFSTIIGNNIHQIHVGQSFSGAEMAGIKFHGAIDVQISQNHIYHCGTVGLWLDWMAQGARVSRNLFHDNLGGDLLFEVDHGPILVDNNIFLSAQSLDDLSSGVAFVHDLFGGTLLANKYDARQTPFFKPHSTTWVGLHDNPRGDDRYYNNLFAGRDDLSQYDDAHMPVWMDGNVFLEGSKPSKFERNPLVKPNFNPEIKLVKKFDGFHLEIKYASVWTTERTRKLVTTKLLGRAAIPNARFEQPDGKPICINTDYFGKQRNKMNPTPGPFANTGQGDLKLKVW